MSRRTNRVFAGVLGATLLVHATLLAEIASAQCADPRGNAYCTNGGLVNVQNPNPPTNVLVPNPNPPQNVDVQNPNPPTNVNVQNPDAGNSNVQNPNASPVQTTTSQPQVPQAPVDGPSTAVSGRGNGSVSVDPAAASAGATVTVSVSGMPANSGFVVNLAQLKTNTGMMFGAKSMQTADGITMQTGPDGSFSGTFTVPEVPDSIAPQASVCAAILGRVSYCTPFTLQSASQPPVNDATPQSIVGHYQCSSELFVGYGSKWCQGTESLLVLNSDSTYSVGDEAGTYTFDPNSFGISFSGPLGNGSILNRKLVTDGTINGAAVRYTYIRMNY